MIGEFCIWCNGNRFLTGIYIKFSLAELEEQNFVFDLEFDISI